MLALLSRFLCQCPRAIQREDVRSLVEECALPEGEAYALLLASCCGLDVERSPRDKALFHRYFLPMVRPLNEQAYHNDPFARGVRLPAAREGRFLLGYDHYKPYEAFVCDDLKVLADGRILPQIGFFNVSYSYPAVWEDGRLWMSVTPNEVETMRQPVSNAHGRVLTYGLGLGYFAWMAARKPDVASVTIVEKSADIAALFRRCLLPQFPCKEKLTIVHADALDYARGYPANFDYLFADLWHDVSDGLPLYRMLKKMEPPHTSCDYWIEKTLRCYE